MSFQLLNKEIKARPTFPSEMDTSDWPQIFITGGTGYIGSRLVKKLLEKNYSVTALVRKGSEYKVPTGAKVVIGNPFDAKTFTEYIPADSILIQLLGVSHPSPKKANLFKEIDLKSVKASADAAAQWEARNSADAHRSEERRVGKECSKQCRSRWSPYH